MFSVLKAQNINNGLVSEYLFTNNVGNTTIDSQGGNTGTIVGTPVLTTNRCNTAGSAYNFNSNDDAIEILAPHNAALYNASYSYSAWVNVTNIPTPGNAGAVLSVGALGADQVFGIYNSYSTIDGFGVITYDANGATTLSSANGGINSATITTGQWYFLTVTRSPTAMNLYVDGVLVDAATNLGAPIYNNRTDVNPPQPFAVIGARHIAANRIHQFGGTIDDLRIYNRELSLCEIDILFRQNPNIQTAINVNNLQTSPISGPTDVCTPSSRTYTVQRQINPCPIAPASNITWTVPTGATITSGQGTNSITVEYGASFTGGSISATEQTGQCTFTPSSIDVSPIDLGCDLVDVNYVSSSSTYVGNLYPATLEITNNNTIFKPRVDQLHQ